MKDENRALIAFNCEDMPDGFMNTESRRSEKGNASLSISYGIFWIFPT